MSSRCGRRRPPSGVELLLGDERVAADPRGRRLVARLRGGRRRRAVLVQPRRRRPPARPAVAAAARGPARAARPSSTPPGSPWSDHGWTGVELADSVIYELHVGTFTARGHARRRHRAARPPGRPRRHPGRAAAARVLPRASTAGATTGSRPGPCTSRTAARPALQRFVDACHAPGTRRLPRRRLQPPRAGRQLPRRVRAVLHRPLRDPVGLGAQPRRRRTATRCTPSSWTTR